MFITPEHQALQDKHQFLVLRSMQFDMIIAQKEVKINGLLAEIAPLKRMVEQLVGAVNELKDERVTLLKDLDEKNKQLQKLELLQHQYDQLRRLVYSRSSEKGATFVSPEQLTLAVEADELEACKITDGKRVDGYTKGKAVDRLKHPGRNEIPAHIERKYIYLDPANLPEDAQMFDKIETEQLEYDPARLFATVYRRHKYKLNKPDGTTEIFIAELPDEKDKSLAAPSLKAHVTTEKYLYHMPI